MLQPATYRVLVLDDDQILLELTTAFLSLAGHEVVAVASIDQALASLEANSSFDLVLTDLNMPGFEGQALANALRSAMPAETPLVGMSATQPAADTRVYFDSFLQKPFSPEDLQEALNRAVRKRVPSSAPGPVGEEPQSSQPVLDETTLQSLARAIPMPKLRQLYDLGLDDVEKRLARMQEAAATGDMATVRREAHAIKGSCGMVGALELQSLASAVEDSTTFDAPAMAQMPHACLRLRRMLDAKLQIV